jgi:hypothetical protein
MTAVVDLSARFRGLLLSSPLMRMMDRGDTLWGDLDLYFPEEMEVGPRRTPLHDCFNLELAAAAPAPLSGEAGMQRAPRSGSAAGDGVQQAYAAAAEAAAPVVEVPPFVVGIKTLIVRNLPRDITAETLRSVFERYGSVRDVYIPKNMDRNSPYFGTVKGFALIKFAAPEESAAAYRAQWGRLVLGKNKITVEFAQADR